jgi:hypothetical protein
MVAIAQKNRGRVIPADEHASTLEELRAVAGEYLKAEPGTSASLHQYWSLPSGNVILLGRDKGAEMVLTNGAFGRHERHESAGMRLVTAASRCRSSVRRSIDCPIKKPRVDGAKFATAHPQISGVGG